MAPAHSALAVFPKGEVGVDPRRIYDAVADDSDDENFQYSDDDGSENEGPA